MTKIVAPILIKNLEQSINTEQYQDADIIEWRVDYTDFEAIVEVAKALKAQFRQPLLFTIRTKSEGGNLDLTIDAYLELQKQLIAIQPAYLDFEFFSYSEVYAEFNQCCQENGVKVVASYHNFDETPTDLEYRLSKMLVLKPAIVKIAVMPINFLDVTLVLSLTARYAAINKTKLVTMSMGELGKFTRVSGHLTGSAWTFASVAASSAPGQLSIAETKQLLNTFKGKYND
ncbi:MULTISPECIES: type I 3-dehydroquinate dehydratase [unclassified Enterococcus]|uniref:type I 3-dehydroquinate dehydratase n=1 Tax=unclassified Enterococcus TaxID=2608891 RepID=UPI0015566996|nr:MULTISPECIES: type I 3-dehydroquinate dehydratase [unclassified Enterococcus]MBS7577524.1 type I 3-dehydroquinate dehydratase [Enterococcus sp. MMGLQ5-2]MBS7584977.1 type I 3-dehydroquinate dehydratase [Enterococcus sp. MMGLQ5-1]NPD12832.1 type I 3-dehydroquinate dehydratase [Enterococcus sp. MMGLQ5-1]NPD37357.1 type I 3-dehydroquinate dehydratase [Enterococcus sp. MMGLQ5-2]